MKNKMNEYLLNMMWATFNVALVVFIFFIFIGYANV